MDLRVELGRRPALLGGPPRGPRTAAPRTAVRRRPARAARARSGPAGRASAGSTRPGRRTGADGLAAALDRLAAEAVAAARARAELLVLTDRAGRVERLPVPSILAAGAVHTALTEAGLRGRTDVVVERRRRPRRPRVAMVLAVGATAVDPRLAIELAAELAGHARRRGRSTPADAVEQPDRRLRSRSAQDARPDGHQRGRVVHRRRALRRRRPRRVGRRPLLPDRRRPGPAGRRCAELAERQLRRRAAALAIPEPAAGREPRLPDPGLRPLPGRRRGPPLLAADRRRDPGRVAGPRRHRRPTRPRRRRRRSPRVATATRSPGRAADRAVPRDELRVRHARRPSPLDEVEDARSIVRRFVVSAMSVGALSARGPPGADDRHPAGRRRREHRRRRRGPGVVRARAPTAAATTPGSSRSRRPASG